MAPIASGTLSAFTVLHSFLHWKSLLAIVIGVSVSWLGGSGVSLMSSQSSVVAGLLVGTVLGVALFRGVPVEPLIAAGSCRCSWARHEVTSLPPPWLACLRAETVAMKRDGVRRFLVISGAGLPAAGGQLVGAAGAALVALAPVSGWRFATLE